MKVYIVMYDDSYNERQIEKIFDNEEDANKYADRKNNENKNWWMYVDEYYVELH